MESSKGNKFLYAQKENNCGMFLFALDVSLRFFFNFLIRLCVVHQDHEEILKPSHKLTAVDM